MSVALPIDARTMMDFLTGLLNTASPTGFAEPAIAYVEQVFSRFPFTLRRTTKGALVAEWAGLASDAPRALTAHVDTLGAMVKEIKSDGRLALNRIGGFAWNVVEGEGCTVLASSGRQVRGTLLVTKPSAHVFASAVADTKRDDEHMEMRLDERVLNAAATAELGIRVGDCVTFDPRVEVGPSGFIRSRYLDDKAGVACIFAAVRAMLEAGVRPAQRTTIHISNYEEVGHGAATGFPPDLVDLVAVDMAAVGAGQTSDEFSACICAKDSGGPYHLDLRRRLEALAEAARIPYKVDIYPYYGSDGEAYWRAGGDVRVGLVGPGLDASHNYERTHLESLTATAQLIVEYLR
jgi:putative aminopeptidase FrvX